MKKDRSKRIAAFFLALALLLVSCPVTPRAEAETMSTEVCPCCGKDFGSISWKKYDKWSNFLGSVSFTKAGHYKISEAFTMKKEFTITANVTIDFGGVLLKAKSGSRGFTVASGGTLTLVNTGGENGRLAGQNTSSDGGAIKVEAGGTLNILSGRVVGKATTYNGGAIYNAGTVNICGGTVEGGTGKYGGNIYNSGTLNIYGGSVEGGNTRSAGYGGNICNYGTVLMTGGAVTAGTATGDNGYGGNIYNGGTLTVKGGTISEGTSQDHGGNLFCSSGSALYVYGGTVTGGIVEGGTKSDGTTFSGYGGNLYITGRATEMKIYGGTFSGGQNTNTNAPSGDNIMLNSGVQAYLYGGTLQTDSANRGGNVMISSYATLEDETRQYSALYVLGGTLTDTSAGGNDIYLGSVNNVFKLYACRYNGAADVLGYAADCCCCLPDETGVTIWNAGYKEGTCTDCLFDQAARENLIEPVAGGHKYENTAPNTYTCSGCGKVRVVETVAATVDGDLYESVEEALVDAQTGSVVKLCADTDLAEVRLSGVTLDLNGFTATADVISATTGDIIDTSSKNTGKLICDDVTLAADNENLPVTYENSIRFCPVDFTQWLEPVDVDTTKVKFYFTQRAAQTVIDNAVLAGNTEVDVQIHLTWKDAEGTKQEKTVVFGSALVKKYAEKWDGRVFVATISGTSGITDLACTWQVTSTATSGTTLSASTLVDAGYIHENLTWDKINSYPIKTQDMTVEEMRQLCVDFMEFNKTFLWTPDTSVDFIKNSSGTPDSMSQGVVYGGLPYVGVASGNPYRMMDYINPETGLVDMKKAIPALENGNSLTMADMKYFGNQCSICVYWAWGRVMNSTYYRWTSSAVPKNGFIVLGDIAIGDISEWNKTYGTDECLAENGEQVAFGGYAKLQKADGMVYYTTAGHLIMAYTDPVVVYNEDGTINGDESYIYIIDQAQKWEERTNASGDTYLMKQGVNTKKTFQQLFDSHYIPFTFAEFMGTDPIEQTKVSLVKDSTTYITGTISEADRLFQATTTKSKLTWTDLMACNITSNYGVIDAYIIIKDNFGNEMYKHAVRTATAGNMNLALEEEGAMVTTWETKALTSGKTYNAEIVVQLATGERPTVWSGQLTMDN